MNQQDSEVDWQVPDFRSIRLAAGLIHQHIHETPVVQCSALNAISRAVCYFKCENFQKTGAFKARGAVNAILQLPAKKAKKGVCTHSSGNHAAALSYAAGITGVPAYIVMPENAPKVKINAVKHYGGNIAFCSPTLNSRETTLNEIQRKTGATFIPSYNHPDVIAGQGTAAAELMREIPELDVILAPVGGGGLISGTAIAAKALNPLIEVIAAEPAQADDAFQSFKAGRIIPSQDPDTIADGLKTSLANLTFAVISDNVDDIITVSEDQIASAMRLIWERMKIIVEPSGAVPFAAVLANPERFENLKTGIILSGGNVDLDKLPWQNL